MTKKENEYVLYIWWIYHIVPNIDDFNFEYVKIFSSFFRHRWQRRENINFFFISICWNFKTTTCISIDINRQAPSTQCVHSVCSHWPRTGKAAKVCHHLASLKLWTKLSNSINTHLSSTYFYLGHTYFALRGNTLFI